MACIYCGKTDSLSESDIIPDSMTNGKILNPNVCKTEHNSKFSDEFESYVFDKLAFILNYLDIKSSKAKDYPKYDTKIVIDDTVYEVKSISNKLDAFSKDVLKSENGASFFGDPEKLKEIAKSKGFNPEEVSYVDLNGKELTLKNSLHYEVFFDTQMFRLAAKIAFEWYCLRNGVDDYHEDFKAIIEYITTGTTSDDKDNIVTIVTDEDAIKILDEFADDGGHILMAYIDKYGGISILVDFMTTCIYNVKICDHIPEFCSNNMLVQYIAVDGSGNRKEECLCKKDYNGLPDVFVDSAYGGNAVVQHKKIWDFEVEAVKMTEKKTSRIISLSTMAMFFLKLFQRGLDGITKPNDVVIKHVVGRLEKLLQKNTIHPRALKRFVRDNETSENICLNPKTANNKDTYFYYLLYKIGDLHIDTLTHDVIKKITYEICGNKNEVRVNKEEAQRFLDEMLADSEYGMKIALGAQTAMNWEE